MNTRAVVTGVFTFEWRYQTRRLTYAVSLTLLAFVAFSAVATGFGPASAAINGPYVVMETVGIASLVSVFALPMLCIGAAVRDDEYQMRELINVRPVSRGVLLGGRFAGVLVAAIFVAFVSVVVQALAPFVVSVRAERLMAFSMWPYVNAFVLLAIPNTLLCTAVIYLVAAATRSTLATFVASVAIYAGYFVTAMMVDSPLMAGTRPATPELLARIALLDPFGLSAFFEQTRYWTPLESNTRQVALQGNLLWNRVLVVAAALLCVWPLLWLDRRSAGRGARWLARRGSAASARLSDAPATTFASKGDLTVDVKASQGAKSVTPHAPSWTTLRHATAAVFRLECSLLLRSWPLRVLVVLWIAVIGIEAVSQLQGGEYGTRILASSAVLADAVPDALLIIGALCALYFAADVVGREHALRFDGVRDATPASNAAILVGKLAALLGIPVLLAVTGYGTAMIVHAASNGLPIEPSVYWAHALTSIVPLWILTVMAFSLQVVMGNRWLALFAGLVVTLLTEIGDNIGLEHPLLRFGAAPALRWTDMDGFGVALPSWFAFQATWMAGALALLIGATVLGPRGSGSSIRSHWRQLPGRLRAAPRTGRRALVAGGIMFGITYAAMIRETVILARWEGQDARTLWRVEYERAFRHLASVMQPEIVDVDLNIDLEPETRTAHVQGTILLENRHAVPIDTLWLHMPAAARVVSLRVDGSAEMSPHERFDVYAMALLHPIEPGGRTAVTYSLKLDRSGLRADGFDSDVAANGTFLVSTAMVPSLGYQGRNEVSDPGERIRYGLGDPTPRFATGERIDSLMERAHTRGSSPAWFPVRTVISTSASQTAHGPGELVKRWQRNNRNFFEYSLPTKSTPFFAITSGRYAVVRRVYRDVSVELHYHPAHAINAERIVDMAVTSLATLERHFGPYPHRTLRLIEIPATWGFGAFALPGSLYLTESRGMLADARTDDVDLMRRRIGHEVAHQWWGHTVDPLPLPGSLVIVETLAKYAEQLLVDAAQGNAILADMMLFDHDRYLRGRANVIGVEPTLRAVTDDDHLYYGKGALAFHALRETLGDSAIIGALRTLLATEGGSHGAATAEQLQSLLEASAKDEDGRRSVREWFEERVIYDLRADSATISGGEDARRVRATFTVQRILTDSSGEHSAPAENAPVTIGILAGDLTDRRVLLRVRGRAVRGVVRIDTLVPATAAYIEIDPDTRLIDRDRSNNRVRLATP